MPLTRVVLALCGGFTGGHAISLAFVGADVWLIVLNFALCGINFTLLSTVSGMKKEESDEALDE